MSQLSVTSPLLDRSLAAVWHPCTQMRHHTDEHALPLVPIVRGQGLWLYDDGGRRFLDGISSWWVNLFGHGNPRINAALRDQLQRLEHVMLAGFTHEPVVRLSERLGALTGGALGHAFYASDGASATEIALKMSFHYWQNVGQPAKRRYVCVAGSYHGETVGALAVTDVALFKNAYGPLTHPAFVAPSPDARQAEAGETAVDVACRAAAGLEALLQREHRQIAALIVEPLVQCANGMAMHHPQYLVQARALCNRYQVHLICDEIAVGFGRTGTFFAHEQAVADGGVPIRPDFLCLSKGITGGYLPLSVVLSTDTVYEAFLDEQLARGFLHSHSYTGNPLACSAALATLDIFDSDDVINANQATAAAFTEMLRPLAGHPRVRHMRQCGMIWAADVQADAGFGRRFYREALAREVLLRPLGNTVYFMPPYIASPIDLEFLARQALQALEAALPANAASSDAPGFAA